MLTRYGRSIWLPATLAAVGIGIALAIVAPWWTTIPVVLAWIAIAGFFRDPPRTIRSGQTAGTMLSPADGRISSVERIDHHPAVDGPAMVIRVFLSVLNVHVNRAPCAGVVVQLDQQAGKYLDARLPEAPHHNTWALATLTTPAGDRVAVRQLSGRIARRIVCDLEMGQAVDQGERYGMIRFGSLTELILPRPDDVSVAIEVGAVVQGGLTVLATLRPVEN